MHFSTQRYNTLYGLRNNAVKSEGRLMNNKVGKDMKKAASPNFMWGPGTCVAGVTSVRKAGVSVEI
jgi:hypothetical protein